MPVSLVRKEGRRSWEAIMEEARELDAELPGVKAGVAVPDPAGVMDSGESQGVLEREFCRDPGPWRLYASAK
jgi:hypothetical protein